MPLRRPRAPRLKLHLKIHPRTQPKPEGGETAAAAPANYSRGEGQKPVTAAYKENWNAIFGKKGEEEKAITKRGYARFRDWT